MRPRVARLESIGGSLWVYVHNFRRPDAPRAIHLEPGQGIRLREMIRETIKTLREELPKAFRQEAFDKEKSHLMEKYNSRAQELNSQFAELARRRGFLIQTGKRGNIYFIPIINGKPLEHEDFPRLSETERAEVEKRQQELAIEMERIARKQQEIMREMEEDIRLIERRFCENLLVPLLSQIEAELRNEEVKAYLTEVREHIISNLEDFKEMPTAFGPFPFTPPPREQDPFLEYEVQRGRG